MSDVKELPEMVTELVDLSKAYIQQEAVEPAKQVGRTVGMGLAAAGLFAVGSLLLAVAALRVIVGLFPDTTLWSALGYAVSFVVLAGVAFLVVRIAAARAERTQS